MRKRKPNIAQSLFRNSKSALFSAIEIHNKPNFEYRYETCTLLLINARELLLKGYIYKNHKKDFKIFEDDGTTKDLGKCLEFLKKQLGKNFLSIKISIEKIYEYRNKIAHCYFEPLDGVLFILFQPNIKLYAEFVTKYIDSNFFTDKDDQLLILPIGIKHILSPIDILTNYSTSNESSKIVQDFIKGIIQSSFELSAEGIEDSIIADYKIYFEHANSAKNAEIVSKFSEDGVPINIHKKVEAVTLTNDPNAKKVVLSPEEILKTHPLTASEMRKGMREHFSNYPDGTGNYNKYVIDLKQDALLCIPYLSNPGSSKPSYKYYFSKKVYTEFRNKYYISK